MNELFGIPMESLALAIIIALAALVASSARLRSATASS